MRRLGIPFALLLLLAVGVNRPVVAQESDGEAVGEAESSTYNLLLFYMGSRIGWVKGTHKTVELDGRSVTHEHEEMWLQIKRSFDGKTFESSSVTDAWYETDGSSIRSVDVSTNGGQTIKTEIKFGEKSATIEEAVDENRAITTVVAYDDKAVYGDLRAWHVLKDSDRLKAGEQLKFWSVDADDQMLVEQTWTVSGRVKKKLSDKTVAEGWQIKIVKQGKSATLIMDDDDLPIMLEDIGGFSIERVKEIPEPFKAERVSLRNTMSANVSIEDYQSLTELVIHFEYEHDDGEGVPEIVDANRYHDVIKYEKGYAIKMKSQRMGRDFEAPAYPLGEVPDDVKKFLEPTSMCQSDDEDLLKEALKLAKGKKDSVSVAKAIMRFADRRLGNGSGDTGSASAKQAYDERTGDCTEHAALFVALARAAGLPARNVGGFVYAYMPSMGKSIFGYHAWAEVWLGEWVPVDATVQELGTSARYVMFEIDEPGETHGNGRSSRCIRQDIQPKIDAYTMADGSAFEVKGAPKWEWGK